MNLGKCDFGIGFLRKNVIGGIDFLEKCHFGVFLYWKNVKICKNFVGKMSKNAKIILEKCQASVFWY